MMSDQDLLTILAQLSHRQKGFCGVIEGIPLTDLVQMLCQVPCGNKRIFLKSSQGDGSIYFMDGEISHAEVSDGEGKAGEEAFYELLCRGDGVFLISDANNVTKTIHVPWHALLMEAMRRMDERKAVSTSKITEVMIVDDSRLFVSALEKILTNECNAKVIAKTSDGRTALGLLKNIRPDLLTIDITMPIMSGDVLLKNIMIRSPAPILLMSSMSSGTMPKIMEFLRLGAVDYIPKPTSESEWSDCLERLKRHVRDVKHYSLSHISRAKATMPIMYKRDLTDNPKKFLVVFGGIGGILEIQRLLPPLCGVDDISIIIFQDMAEGFLKPFTDYLAKSFCFQLSLLQPGDILYGNICKVASWSKGWGVIRNDKQAPPSVVQHDMPVDFNMFLSDIAKDYGTNLYVMILSGTNLDIEAGLQDVVTYGGHIFLQNPKTAIFAEPLLQIAALELEEAIIDPAKLAEILMKK